MGYFAGLKEGMFLPIEEHALKVTNCKRPQVPAALRSEYVKEAMSFWPMAKQMITVKWGGVEPKFLSAVEDIVERMVILSSIAVGRYEESAYCYGAIHVRSEGYLPRLVGSPQGLPPRRHDRQHVGTLDGDSPRQDGPRHVRRQNAHHARDANQSPGCL